MQGYYLEDLEPRAWNVSMAKHIFSLSSFPHNIFVFYRPERPNSSHPPVESPVKYRQDFDEPNNLISELAEEQRRRSARHKVSRWSRRAGHESGGFFSNTLNWRPDNLMKPGSEWFKSRRENDLEVIHLSYRGGVYKSSAEALMCVKPALHPVAFETCLNVKLSNLWSPWGDFWLDFIHHDLDESTQWCFLGGNCIPPLCAWRLHTKLSHCLFSIVIYYTFSFSAADIEKETIFISL